MRKISPLIRGTIVLTITGFISRIIGFFYRVFLSRTFGEEGMGLYQLISPVLALSFSFCVAGIQTAISKYVASETTTHDYRHSFHILVSGIGFSMLLSLFFSHLVYRHSVFIATYILLEPRCASLLRIIALSVPFASLHSCINGYFYGIKQTAVPAASQLLEQCVRVGSVYLLYWMSLKKEMVLTINCAVIGLVVGEIASMLISIIAIYTRFYAIHTRITLPHISEWYPLSRKLFSLALPLSANRIILNLLQSVEAIYIPNSLMHYGLSTKSALSIYGVLTGMALPLILFPSALTNSLSVMLLPTISEAEAIGNQKKIRYTIRKCIYYCLLLGGICTLGFLFVGRYLGTLLFHTDAVGPFIITLSFICPFLYLSTTLGSILHGLGKMHLTFCFSVTSLAIRLLFVFLAIPYWGIRGYLVGLLISQLLLTLLDYIALRKFFPGF